MKRSSKNMPEYEKEAMKFKPDKIKYLFIAEAPPDADANKGEVFRYFYFVNVALYDYLLQNIVETLFSEKYNRSDKKRWLNKLKENRFFLIDAVEKPIKKGTSDSMRAKLINENFPRLLQKIKELAGNDTKLILIKKIVFDELENKLKARGFNVINTEMLDFPAKGRQPQFREKFKNLIIKERIIVK